MNEIIARILDAMSEAEVIRSRDEIGVRYRKRRRAKKIAARAEVDRMREEQGLPPKKWRGPKVVEDHIAVAKRLPPDPLLAWAKSRSSECSPEVKFKFWGLGR